MAHNFLSLSLITRNKSISSQVIQKKIIFLDYFVTDEVATHRSVRNGSHCLKGKFRACTCAKVLVLLSDCSG